MFEVTLGVIGLLVATGAVLIALEMEALPSFKGPAVSIITLAVGGAIFLFFMADADGKIGWGDKIAAEESKSRSNDGDGDGEDGKGGMNDRGGGGGGNGQGGTQNGEAEIHNGKKKKRKKDNEEDADEKPELVFFRDCDICPLMVVVNSGKFKMGSPDTEAERRHYEGPVRKIAVRRTFAASVMEITRAQYKAFISVTKHQSSNECVINNILTARRSFTNPGIKQEDADPVTCINWHDATAYVGWLTQKTGGRYRLLSEAEWEYAARADRAGMYSFNGEISKMQANYDRIWRGTMPSGSFGANEFGINDAHGNVWEWVADCWHDTYVDRPLGRQVWGEDNEGDCSMRVVRGGGWDSPADELRSASRGYESILAAKNTIGIRVAKTLSIVPASLMEE